jgi:hypothetical protein
MKHAEKSTIKSSTSLRCMVSRWKQPIKTSNADAHLIWSESDDKHQINSLSRTTFLLRLHREYTPRNCSAQFRTCHAIGAKDHARPH